MAIDYWGKIKDASLGLFEDAQRELYVDLKPLILTIEELSKKVHPPFITEDRFNEICMKILPYATLVDHTTLNVGAWRLEKVVEFALKKGFVPNDYFLPIDNTSGMISVVLGHPQWKLYLAINEGLDGWTRHTLNRVADFRTLLKNLFKDEKDKKILPKIGLDEEEEITSGRKESRIYVQLPGCSQMHMLVITNEFYLSHISDFVKNHGEGIQHFAIDTHYLISPSIPYGYSLESLFKLVKEHDILPLTSDIMTGNAGRTLADTHQVKQFFSGELGYGFFFEFIERTGRNAKRGLFVANTVLGLYRAKEPEIYGFRSLPLKETAQQADTE